MGRKPRGKSPKATQFPGFGLFPEYLQTTRIKESLLSRYSYVRELAAGKYGVAHLLKSEKNPHHHFCLKTIRPEVQVPQERMGVRDSLRKECEILQPLAHRCLPTIYEADLDGDPPYYVCTYHPGQTFASFQEKGKRLSLQEAAFVVWSLIDVLKYVHAAGRTHCDLHARNALISESVLQDGILIVDFGAGHRGSDTTSETPNTGNVFLKDASQQRQNRRSVDRLAAKSGFERSDKFALGKLLGVMEDCFIPAARLPTRLAYRDFHQALQQGRLEEWEKIEDAFMSVLDPFRALTSNEDLFLSREGTSEAITIPVSGRVSVGEAPLAVINTRVFQRLRDLKQLSFCDWFFPGANHTRFEHSLGVFGIAKRAVEALTRDSDFREALSADEIRGGLLAALVHDVGHYPFAHVMEQYARGRFPDSPTAKNAASHEMRTIALMENDLGLKSAIEDHWGEAAMVCALKILERDGMPILTSLVDGPIDIDKMDYLTRDSYHCGVRFGDGLDVDRLLRSLRCVDQNQAIGINEDGISAVEGLMVLQDQMLAAVYWYEPVRGIISMFHAIVAHLVKTDENAFLQLVSSLQQYSSEQEAVRNVFIPWIDKALLDHKITPDQKEQLLRLVSLYEKPVYSDIYVPIKSYKAADKPTPGPSRVTVFQAIVNFNASTRSIVPIDWANVRALRRAYQKAFAEKNIPVDDIEIVIDVPFGKSPRSILKVRTGPDGREDSFANLSHLSETIFVDPTRHLAPVRVYLAPARRSQASEHLSSIVRAAEEHFFARGESAIARDDE